MLLVLNEMYERYFVNLIVQDSDRLRCRTHTLIENHLKKCENVFNLGFQVLDCDIHASVKVQHFSWTVESILALKIATLFLWYYSYHLWPSLLYVPVAFLCCLFFTQKPAGLLLNYTANVFLFVFPWLTESLKV